MVRWFDNAEPDGRYLDRTERGSTGEQMFVLTPADAVQIRSGIDRLIAAVAALPEREAMVIQLYHVEELNLEEIGQVLGVGSARVCQIKKSAHDRLRKALAS